MRDDLQRVAADFENYKRRAAREREQASAAAETRLLGELLDGDRRHRAGDRARRRGRRPTKAAVVEGLRTVHARLDGVVQLARARARRHAGRTFDPNLHEAMMVQPAPDGEPDDTILQVLQSGWKLGDRVLRHARVIVAGGG